MSFIEPKSRDEFTVAIICALNCEYDAVLLSLDDIWDCDGGYGRAPNDHNHYENGRIGKHNVVLVYLPNMGKRNAASTAAQLNMSYTRIRLTLVVGVCGGVPFTSGGDEVLLGDVIIADKVFEYDYGKRLNNRLVPQKPSISLRDGAGQTNRDVRGLLRKLESFHGKASIERHTLNGLEKIQTLVTSDFARESSYKRPDAKTDRLYNADHRHKHWTLPCPTCEACLGDQDATCDEVIALSCTEAGCGEAELKPRERLTDADSPGPELRVYLGALASGDSVIRSASFRDQITEDMIGAVMLEMEGAGVYELGPSLVVKGVCDYADSHKNKGWQQFASARAAAAAKAVLQLYTATDTPKPSTPTLTANAAPSHHVVNYYTGNMTGTNVMPGMMNFGSVNNYGG